MFGMNDTPIYRGAAVAAMSGGVRTMVKSALAGTGTPGYRGDGQPPVTQPGLLGLFPGTPAYQRAPTEVQVGGSGPESDEPEPEPSGGGEDTPGECPEGRGKAVAIIVRRGE